MRRHYRFRSEDAASQPHPKRRCGAKAATASEDGLRRARRAPTMDPSGQSANAAQRTAEPPTTPTNPGAATSQARGRRRAQRGPGGGALVGAQPRAKGDRGSGGYPPGKTLRAIANRTESPGAKGDAGWLRGQTTRRRIHRRSDGGPERRQVLRRGTRAPLCMLHRNPPLRVKTGITGYRVRRCFS
jgi:hypothetical protein